MLIFRQYDKDKSLDRAWYNSSNIFYTECDDKENDFKALRVTFNNGATYEYIKVNVHDYLMFMKGGTDGSNGKALNTFIKKKFECRRLDNLDTEELTKERIRLTEEYYKSLQDSGDTTNSIEQQKIQTS